MHGLSLVDPCDSLAPLRLLDRESAFSIVPPPPLAQRIALGLMHATQVIATSAILMAFDWLEVDGEDQRQRPLPECRQALEHLLEGERLILLFVRLSPRAWTRGRKCCGRDMKV